MFRVEEKTIPHMHRLLPHRKAAFDAVSNHLSALRTKSLPPGPTYLPPEQAERARERHNYERHGYVVHPTGSTLMRDTPTNCTPVRYTP